MDFDRTHVETLQRVTAGDVPGQAGRSAMLVYAHPDDEAIAAGARLPSFANSLFIQVTDGAPRDNADGARLGLSRDEYRAMRKKELRAALRIGGLPAPRHKCLEYVDKEVALSLIDLTKMLVSLINAERPAVLFTHPYEGGHADHDACCFAVHTAVKLLHSEARNVPLIFESPFYFRRPGGGLQTGSFLPAKQTPECLYQLTADEQQRKQAVFAAFSTQTAVLQMFPTNREAYRLAPDYRFTEPPHDGPTWSETITPELKAQRFCELAAEAERALLPQTVIA